MYRGADNDVSRVLTRGHVGASIAASRKRDGRRSVAAVTRAGVCVFGKTLETLIADQEHYASEVVTNFNQFGRIMPGEPGGL
jgi:hypothetical protein